MIESHVYESLGLTQKDYQDIVTVIGREPSLTELAMFSVEWSEHCGYRSSRSFLSRLPKEGKYKALVGEDSGGIVVDDIAIVFKMESHNHPSQVEPKQGAATGVGGIIRDIFTAGVRPIASLNSLRFGDLDIPYNRYLTKGVVNGIQFYGNCLGVPTVGGEIYFEPSYTGNCLVNAMSIGVGKVSQLAQAKLKGVGNSVMYVGASTGRDGIGGCSVLASQEFCEGEEKRPAVQIGDPFTEKCLIEATLEALDTGYVLGIKDMGAAGLTCSVSEMASAGELGIEIDLDKVPRREKNMEPWEVMMSESQERMLVCVLKGKEQYIEAIFKKWGLTAVVIGKATDDNLVRIRDKGRIVANVPAGSLTTCSPWSLSVSEPEYIEVLRKFKNSDIPEPRDYNIALKDILGSPSVASKRWVYEQYDHMVQTNTVVLPGSDAAVLRLKDTDKAIAAVTDCNSRYCYLNPYRGAQIAVAEAARNIACSGARPAAVTDCLNFGNPQKPDRYWQFKNCLEGIIDSCSSFKLPVVSGNVSFYNENPNGAIYPTPTIGMIGIMDDIENRCTQYFKEEDCLVVLIGETQPEIGGSQYLKCIHGRVAGDAPGLDLSLEKKVHDFILGLIERKLVLSAHDCSEGGLAVALAESCFAQDSGMIGVVIDNLGMNCRRDFYLFGESQSRIIISCNKEKLADIERLSLEKGVTVKVIGKTGADRFVITDANKKLIDLSLKEIYTVWDNSLENLLNPDKKSDSDN